MKVRELLARELERFERVNPRSLALAREAEGPLLAGVPMPWMIRWAGGFSWCYHGSVDETLLIVDETHTICAGHGGYTAAHGLEPDPLTIGKPIAGGVPAAAYGFSREVAERLEEPMPRDEGADIGGIGGTMDVSIQRSSKRRLLN